MTSINDRLNNYIDNTFDKPRFQAAEIKRHFDQSKHIQFLKKIRDHEEFYISRSNGQHRLTVSKGEINLSELRVIKDEIPTMSIFSLGIRYETITTKYFPDKSDFIIKLNRDNEIEVKSNSAVKDLVSMLEFVDFELFESK